MNEDVTSPVIRELFIEELAEVEGGAQDAFGADLQLTTQACCEELILSRCCL